MERVARSRGENTRLGDVSGAPPRIRSREIGRESLMGSSAEISLDGMAADLRLDALCVCCDLFSDGDERDG
jgi:hypothetical protein